mmetsp:Transcript_15524/g.48276  ORF Transcript_15524/g.48276 Transcript_15524/m.48276 type:complete len:391 (-) Transcript_15524:3-1175(-)
MLWNVVVQDALREAAGGIHQPRAQRVDRDEHVPLANETDRHQQGDARQPERKRCLRGTQPQAQPLRNQARHRDEQRTNHVDGVHRDGAQTKVILEEDGEVFDCHTAAQHGAHIGRGHQPRHHSQRVRSFRRRCRVRLGLCGCFRVRCFASPHAAPAIAAAHTTALARARDGLALFPERLCLAERKEHRTRHQAERLSHQHHDGEVARPPLSTQRRKDGQRHQWPHAISRRAKRRLVRVQQAPLACAHAVGEGGLHRNALHAGVDPPQRERPAQRQKNTNAVAWLGRLRVGAAREPVAAQQNKGEGRAGHRAERARHLEQPRASHGTAVQSDAHGDCAKECHQPEHARAKPYEHGAARPQQYEDGELAVAHQAADRAKREAARTKEGKRGQ